MKKIIFSALVLVLLSACQFEENDYLNRTVALATVENPTKSTDFYLNLDNGGRIKVGSSAIPYYRPLDGQRIIADYSITASTPQSSIYSHVVRLNDVYEVLTKGIFDITPATQDSIGNDKVMINDIWISGNYLNIEFEFMGYSRVHYINLVKDATKSYTDGKVHLEFRHNANDDYPDYNKSGIVSFNLNSLRNNDANEVKLVIHANEYYNSGSTYNLTYVYGNSSHLVNQKQIQIPVGNSSFQ